MRFSSIAAVTLVTALAACNGGVNSIPAGSSSSALTSSSQMQPTAAQLGLWPRPGDAVRVCGDVAIGYARCQAWIRTDVKGFVRDATPSGYGPSDLQTAYNLTSYSSSNGSGETVAIVDAFHDPDAATDVAAYRKQYGLPACTASSGCFSQKSYTTKTNKGWGVEESLDIEMVSAICPKCKILLVEAASARRTSALSTAEVYATAHANYVSNSWSGNEGTKTYDKDYNVSGVAITAATGDNGYNKTAQWPAILAIRHRRWRNVTHEDQSAHRDGMVRGGKRLQQSLCEAELPERHHYRLFGPRRSRRLGRCKSEYGCRGLRHGRL